jgi:SsrA-binding protein
MGEKKKAHQELNIVNRRAHFDYSILQKYISGIQLNGTEVKSIKAGNANMNEAYCQFEQDELYVKNLHITEYTTGGYLNHEPLRKRKLLLNKTELRKIQGRLKEQGLTVIPLKLFLSETSYIKLEIGLAKGKKSFDKRESLKKKDMERDMKSAQVNK